VTNNLDHFSFKDASYLSRAGWGNGGEQAIKVLGRGGGYFFRIEAE
jgi:hypothetical protein